MIGFRLTVTNGKKIEEWAAGLPDDFARRAALLVGAHALTVEREAKQAAPVASGILKSSIHTQMQYDPDRTAARIGTKVHYAPYLEMGTGRWGPRGRPYEITPKRKRALAFVARAGTQLSTGRPMYRSRTGRLVVTRRRAARTVVRRVIHPGIRPRPYLYPALERSRPKLRADLHKLGDLMFPGRK